MGQLVVSKFGGSSVADACAIRRCAKIIEASEDQHFIVVSATYDTTNQLEKLAQKSLESKSKANEILSFIIKRHKGISLDLDVFEQISERLNLIEEEAKRYIININNTQTLSLKNMDALYSIGERLSSLVVSSFLNAELIDARQVLRSDDFFGAANPLVNVSKALAKEVLIPMLNEKKQLVTQGFISSTIEGHITTLGREGSDYSAALFAEMIDAKLINIWTDVPGVFTCDPKKVEGVRKIPRLSYHLATRLASLGAKVLFPRTLAPAKRAGIEVFVGSSLEPEKGGTLIGNDEFRGPLLLGIAQEENSLGTNISLIGSNISQIKNLKPKDFLENNSISIIESVSDDYSITFLIDSENANLATRILHDYLLSFIS